MAMFEFLKKKKEELPLPPPPLPPLRGDMESIQPPMPQIPLLAAPQMQTPRMPQIPMMQEEEEQSPRVFDRTIPSEPPRRVESLQRTETVHHMPSKSFVAVEDYRRIVNDTNVVRSKLLDAENFVKRLTELRTDEERSLEKWRSQLEDVEKKLGYVDQLIEKAQR
ncbi:hypothetical protein J4219_03475 [Candidatus Woesearchaeota archaeon]|nr:hypothetical protein [Candidatus Woesearchaeota archaeon]